MKYRPKRLALMFTIFLFLILLISLTIYLKSVADYKQAVKETSISEIDFSNIPDGVYVGEYDVNFIYAKVKVSMKNGEIADIDILEHKNEHGKPAETMIYDIVNEQKIDIDAISSATNSSTVIKKDVENALAGETK